MNGNNEINLGDCVSFEIDGVSYKGFVEDYLGNDFFVSVGNGYFTIFTILNKKDLKL